MLRTTVATVAGAILLAGAAATTGVVVGSQSASSEATVPEEWPFSNSRICAPLNTTFDYDPCESVRAYYDTGFILNLQKTPFFLKWQIANPGEWSRIVAYMLDDTEFIFTPALTKTWFGSVVRDAISMCKAARCRSMPIPTVPATAVPNDTQAPTPPIVDNP